MIIIRYFFSSVFNWCLLLFFMLSCLLFIGQVLEQSDNLNNNFRFVDLVWYSIQLLPSELIELSAVIISIGTMIALALMAHHSEVNVLRCSGQSIFLLLHKAMLPALVFLLLIWGIGELNIAKLEQNAKAQKSLLLSNNDDGRIDESEIWFKHDNNYYHLSNLFSSGVARKITRWQPSEAHNQIVRIQTIASMTYESYNPENEYWLQDKVKVTNFDTQQIATEQFEFKISKDLPSVTTLNSLSQDITKLPFSQLVALYKQSRAHELAFWGKLLQPFNFYSLMLLSCLFIFISGRQRDTGSKILMGSCCAVGGYMLQTLMPSVSIVFNLTPLYTLLFPIILIFGAAAFFIYKIK